MLSIRNFFVCNGENKICNNLSNLLKIHALFMIATGMSNIFLNIFIWKVSNNSFAHVIKYNILLCIFLPIAYFIGGWISKKRGLRINLILGMSMYTIFYIFVFIFRNNILDYIYIIGILRGASSGFYYIAFNVLGFDFSTDKNRDYYFGLLGFINSTAAMLSPFVSGFIISRFTGITGYEIVFAFSFILFLIGSIMSFSIPDYFIKSKYYIRSVLSLPFKNSNWTKVMISESCRGGRDLVVSLLTTVIVFTIAGSELQTGNYSFWTNLVATLACYAAGILINPGTRIKYMTAGAITTALVTFIFLFNISMTTLWIFGLISVISVNFLFIPHNTISLAVISSIPKSRQRRIEAMVVKELFLNIGRITSVTVFYFVTLKQELVPYFFSVVGMLALIMMYMLKTVDTSKLKHHIISPKLEYEHRVLGFRHSFRATSHFHNAH